MKRHDVEMTFGEHLEELRKRIWLAGIGVMVAACFCGIYYKQMLTVLCRPYAVATRAVQADVQKADAAEKAEKGKGEPSAEKPPAPPALDLTAVPEEMRPLVTGLHNEIVELKAQMAELKGPKSAAEPAGPAAPAVKTFPPRLILDSPIAGYVTILLLTAICGLCIASPWVAYQLWSFIGVGLQPNERRFVRIYGPVSFLLFVAGASTFYFLLLPFGLKTLLGPTSSIIVDGFQLIDPTVTLENYLRFIGWMVLIMGLSFQTPLVVLFLARTRIVPLRTLARKQKIIIFGMIVAGAFLAPSGDPISCTIMAVPLILLYEIGLLIAWLMERRDRREHPERFIYDDLYEADKKKDKEKDQKAPADEPEDIF
jgi:sec-independent protein translocase protein TatC